MLALSISTSLVHAFLQPFYQFGICLFYGLLPVWYMLILQSSTSFGICLFYSLPVWYMLFLQPFYQFGICLFYSLSTSLEYACFTVFLPVWNMLVLQSSMFSWLNLTSVVHVEVRIALSLGDWKETVTVN